MFKSQPILPPSFGQRKSAMPAPGVDRHAYNYGRGNQDYMDDPEYRRTRSLAYALATRVNTLSHAAWELSEALRYVRQAETKEEYMSATAALAPLRVKNDLLGIDSTYNQANMPNEPSDI